MKPTFIRRSLRTKIFLRFTLLIGLALIATGSVSVFIGRNTIMERTIDDLISTVNERSAIISSIINTHRNTARLLASDTGTIRFLSEDASNISGVRTHLLYQSDTIPEVIDIVILNKEGVVQVSTDSRLEGNDLSSLEHFQRGTQGAYIGTLHVSEGRKNHLASAPIRDESGQLLGVLIAEFSLNNFYAAVAQASELGETGEFLLLEPAVRNGDCFSPRWSVFSAHRALPPPKNNERPLSLLHRIDALRISPATFSLVPMANAASSLCLAATGGREGVFTETDENGQDVLSAHTRLSELGLGLIVKVEEREIFQPLRLFIVVLIGTTCILLLFVTFVALRLSHDVVRPILHLRESLEQLNTGHWELKRSIFTGDELEVLDKEAAKLAERLKEAYSSLEDRVKERTRQLANEHAKDAALLESIGEGVLAIDMNGKVMTCNQAAERILSWSREQVIGSHFSSVLNLRAKNGRLLAPNEHLVQKSIEEGRAVRTTPTDSYSCERKDGTSLPIGVTAMPFLSEGKALGVVVTFRDVSEERRIDRMKSEFISLASHQLRTPLTAIGWYVELMQSDENNLSQDQKDYIQQIVDSHRRMADLVNALLNVSRIELGRLKIEPKNVKVKEVVDMTVRELAPQMEKKNLRFIENVPEDCEAVIDVDLIGMVLENLLSNSVKYTPEKGEVELAIRKEGEQLHFTVRDTGIGIPKAQEHKVFEKLFRADNVQKTDTDGTGIGLYITHSVVEAWGGKLSFESVEDKGTTFTFTMPQIMKKREATANTVTDSSSLHSG